MSPGSMADSITISPKQLTDGTVVWSATSIELKPRVYALEIEEPTRELVFRDVPVPDKAREVMAFFCGVVFCFDVGMIIYLVHWMVTR